MTNNLLLLKLYFEDTQGRKMVLDQSRFRQYRLNESNGLYSGFLRTDFPVLDDVEDIKKVHDRILDHQNVTDFVIEEPLQGVDTERSKQVPILKVSHVSARGWRRFFKVRDTAMRHFSHENSGQLQFNASLFGRLSASSCGMQMTSETEDTINSILRNASIPSFADKAVTNSSVAFHIRRGDKVKAGESRAFEAQEYVDVLVQALSESKQSSLQSCFVATDAYPVVAELEAALRNASIGCRLYTLATSDYSADRNTDHTMSLLAEIKMLVDASFFVGSFNSNVGALVSLWRGCSSQRRRSGASEANRFHHYFQSYGEDSEEWLMM